MVVADYKNGCVCSRKWQFAGVSTRLNAASPRALLCQKNCTSLWNGFQIFYCIFFPVWQECHTFAQRKKKNYFYIAKIEVKTCLEQQHLRRTGVEKATSNRFVDRTSKREFGGKMFNSLFRAFHANTSSREFSGECMHRLAIHCKVNWHSK